MTKRHCRKSSSVVAAVIAKKALGESNSQIARDLGIDRGTVVDILDSSDFPQAVDEGRIRVHRMVPKACDAVESALERGNGYIALKILQGLGVLNPSAVTVAPVLVNLNVSLPSKDDPLE